MKPPILEIFPNSSLPLSDARSLIDQTFNASLNESRQDNLENQHKLEVFISPLPDTVIDALAKYLDSHDIINTKGTPFLAQLQDSSQLCIFMVENSRTPSWSMVPVSGSALTSPLATKIMVVVHHPSAHSISIDALSNMISHPVAKTELEKYFTDYSVFIGELAEDKSRRWSFGLPDLNTTDILAELLDCAHKQYALSPKIIDQFQPQMSDLGHSADDQEQHIQRLLLRRLLKTLNEQPEEFSYHENRLEEFANQASLFTSLFIDDFLHDDPQLHEVLAGKLTALTGTNLLKDPLGSQRPEILLMMDGLKLESILSEPEWQKLCSVWQNVLSASYLDAMPSITLKNGWSVSVKLEHTTSSITFACLEIFMPDASQLCARVFVLPSRDVRGSLQFSSPQEMSRFLDDHFASLLHSQLSSLWIGELSR